MWSYISWQPQKSWVFMTCLRVFFGSCYLDFSTQSKLFQTLHNHFRKALICDVIWNISHCRYMLFLSIKKPLHFKFCCSKTYKMPGLQRDGTRKKRYNWKYLEFGKQIQCIWKQLEPLIKLNPRNLNKAIWSSFGFNKIWYLPI